MGDIRSEQEGFLASDVEALKRSISNNLRYRSAKIPLNATRGDWLLAAELAVRNRLVERWMRTARAYYEQNSKMVYYLSMEFLIGRTFHNALQALDIGEDMKKALQDLAVDMEEISNHEPDAALGNGGLGRLAACFLDSMATLNLPNMGYGIRYEYGMFKQEIIDGYQVETPDYWLLTRGNPWEFPRPEVQFHVRYGGHIRQEGGRARWVDTHSVLAMAYDTIIPGYGTECATTLRLWSAKAASEINLADFNQGNYSSAVESKNMSENITRVLYPDDSTPHGKELRLRQEYFFVSASIQDMIRRHQLNHSSFDDLAESMSIHLNDTHPVLAVPELMRILVDEQGLRWDHAWSLTQRIFSYTNHTLMSEALETWPLDLIGRVLPRHLMIIFDINNEFLSRTAEKFGNDSELMRRISLIDETGERRVRMAYLAVVASHKVNGVSKLHSELMKQSIFADFAKIFPDRFMNITNGITPRRWVSQANPLLSQLIDNHVGKNWRVDFEQLGQINSLESDERFITAFRAIKRQNKQRLARWVRNNVNVELNLDSLFDVQIKRIHEYKRQLLNVLHVITRYNRIVANSEVNWVPRSVIFAGKAASAYQMAKDIIKLINDVAAKVNNDPNVGNKLKVVFIPNYGVSLAEMIIPAADLSQQISMAGTEASGTGNMKLAVNGALTMGTLDGANIEIMEKVGADNIFIFGNTAEQIEDLRLHYQPRDIYERNPELKMALDQIRDGFFSPNDPGRFRAIYDSLINYGDRYMLLADYESYIATQEQVDTLYRQSVRWDKKAIHNIANMGYFSSDRTIAEYAKEIWGSTPIRF
ncbi:MAG: glycogen/starch/alpha-glucan phosphorylase [Alistipes senegalensis]|nr:glycogen/starch/alpha-glucan phosphorylase [Oxalobacter formigenes]MCM1281470.1 glycogen/starch/alpha-glucan phosphorylase [Alistipes senegalensis]